MKKTKLAQKVKGVLFDLDGTLLDTEALSDRAVVQAFGNSLSDERRNELLAREGWILPWELKRKILGLRGAEWIPIVIRYGQDHWGVANTSEEKRPGSHQPPSLEEFWDSWEQHLNNLCGRVKACPGAAELVNELSKADIPMAIATSSRMTSVEKKRINHERMFQRMSAIVAGDDPAVKNGKPAPDIYFEAAKRLGLDPSECLVFEDAMSGVQAGKSAGCFVVAVPDPRMDTSLFEPVADVVIKDLREFDGNLLGLNLNEKCVLN